MREQNASWILEAWNSKIIQKFQPPHMELCKIVLSPAGIYAQEQHQPWVEIFFEGA